MTTLTDPNTPSRTTPLKLSLIGRRLVRRMIDDDNTFLRRAKRDPRISPVADRLLHAYREELLENLQRCLEETARGAAPATDTARRPGNAGLANAGEARRRASPIGQSPQDAAEFSSSRTPGGLVRTVSDVEKPPFHSLSPEERGVSSPPGDPPTICSAAADDFRPGGGRRRRRRMRHLSAASYFVIAITVLAAGFRFLSLPMGPGR